MATKEEHLWQLVTDKEPLGMYEMLLLLAEARAERDAAKESNEEALADYEKVSRKLEEARAAIRAQQPPVDREAIRRVAWASQVLPHHAKALLRAIGDEPGEAPAAPASAPQAEPTKIHGIPVYVDPACPPDKLYFAAGSVKPTGANSFAKIEDIGDSSPPAPAEAEGPYRADSDWLCEGSYEYDLGCEDTARTIARRANLGWKAEQGKLVRPPETREEMLCEFLRLAIELGDEKPIGFDQVCACPATAWEERERVLRPFVRAHLAKRKAAEQKEAARD